MADGPMTSTTVPPPDAEWLVNQIAHTLRNPIFAAMVQAEAMTLRLGEGSNVANAAQLVHRQLKRLEADINEMLLYGRPPRLQPRQFDLARLVRRMAETYRRGEHGEVVEVQTVGDDHAVLLLSDPDAVTVVLKRLLANAIQHSPSPHEIAIELKAWPSEIELAVRDHGSGIPEEIREKLFLPFYPQHSGRPGLGLAVAAKFAHALGGRLTIESMVGEGTVARFKLPSRPVNAGA